MQGDTPVCLSDGRRLPISDLVGTPADVVSFNSHGRLADPRPGSALIAGVQNTVEVNLASGRQLTMGTGDRLLTGTGWASATTLKPDARIAIARVTPEPGWPVDWSDARVALLGQLVGDGSYLRNAPMRYTTSSDENSAMVMAAARSEFGSLVKRYPSTRTWHQLLISGNGNRWHPAGVNKWLRELGIFGQRSHQKRIPASAFQLPNRQVALLLRHLWATDGCIWIGEGRHACTVHYSTNSPGLAADVAALLLRLAIVARTAVSQKRSYRRGFLVHVSGATDQLRFLDTVGAFGPKSAAASELRLRLEGTKPNTNVDTLPPEVFDDVKARMRQLGVSTRAMARMRGTAFAGDAHFGFAPSRATVLDYAQRLDDTSLFSQATSDLFWDRVVSVTSGQAAEAYNLMLGGLVPWLADGVLVQGAPFARRATTRG